MRYTVNILLFGSNAFQDSCAGQFLRFSCRNINFWRNIHLWPRLMHWGWCTEGDASKLTHEELCIGVDAPRMMQGGWCIGCNCDRARFRLRRICDESEGEGDVKGGPGGGGAGLGEQEDEQEGTDDPAAHNADNAVATNQYSLGTALRGTRR